MDAPFGILFLKKVELYNLIKDLRKKVVIMRELHPGSPNPITWPVEEKILKWTYHGHKYLEDSINKTDFNLKLSQKMSDWELLDINNNVKDEYQQAVKQWDSIFKNMVSRGFAQYKIDDHGNKYRESIIISNEGLLLGEIIYNTQRNKIIYEIYSKLVDSVGAWILLILFILTILITSFMNFFNIHAQFISWLIDIINS